MAQRVVLTPDQYYSRGIWQPDVTVDGGTGIATVTFAKGNTIDFFSYTLGNVMDGACVGITGRKATFADTNLTGSAGTPIGGDHVVMDGVALQIVPSIGGHAAKCVGALMAECNFAIYYDGQKLGLNVGPPYFVPGRSTLFGTGDDVTQPTSVAGDTPAYGFFSNGAPHQHNYFRIPEKLHWNAAGQVDSNMIIRLTLHRDVSFTIPATRAAVADGAAFQGVPAWTQPGASLLQVDLMCCLVSTQIGDRSRIR